jgi:hypothetical protein
MKAAQEETVKKLFKAEETNVKLTGDVSRAESLYNTTKLALTDEQKRWTLQKDEYTGEIESLKVLLAKFFLLVIRIIICLNLLVGKPY